MTFSSAGQSVPERLAARSVADRQEQATAEVRTLVEAGLATLRRAGAAGLTVAEVLRVARLSTRAFYRHFGSKDELVLAVYEHESQRAHVRLRDRMAVAGSSRAALEVWVDETLALGYDRRRAARTRVLAAEGARLQAEHPDEFARILAATVEPLVAALHAVPSPDPERDARTVHALTWDLVVEKLHGGDLTRDAARAHVLRFCLPALGLAGRPAPVPEPAEPDGCAS